jgi:hypothetical protein
MKKTIMALTLILSGLSLSSMAQDGSGVISGKVTDEQKKPAEAVSISLLHAKDSSLAKTISTDKSGLYRFSGLTAGQYLILASSVGMQKIYTAPVSLDAEKPDVVVPEIKMTAASQDLKTVTRQDGGECGSSRNQRWRYCAGSTGKIPRCFSG